MNNIPLYKRLIYIFATVAIGLIVGYLIYTGSVLL